MATTARVETLDRAGRGPGRFGTVTVAGSEVSVVIPTYRNAARLLQALEAVAAQTVRPLEVVVADDASHDDTAAVVDQFGAAHPGLPIVFVPSRPGCSS